MSYDKIISMINEIGSLKVELEELQEFGELEDILEKSIEIEQLGSELLKARLDE